MLALLLTGLFLLVFPSLANAQTIVQACEGSTVSLEAVILPENTHTDVRQWQVSSTGAENSFSNISGATALTHTFTASADYHNKYFRVRFANSGGQQQTYSKVFKVAVSSLPNKPKVNNGSRTGVGQVQLSVDAQPNYTYRWYVVPAGGVAISGTSGHTFTTPELSATTTYYVAAVNAAGCEGLRESVTATVTGVNSVTIVNSGIISNTDAAKPIDALRPIGTEGAIEAYRITKLPEQLQGKLFIQGVPVLAGQEISPSQAQQLSFDPEPTFYGTASFTYKTIDKQGTQNEAIGIYNIPVNAAPIARNIRSNEISSKEKTRILLPKLLDVIDLDGEIRRYTIVSTPSSGSLYAVASGGNPLTAGSNLNSGQLYYYPENGVKFVTLEFLYKAVDDKGAESNVASYFLNIEIMPNNKVPVADAITTQPVLSSTTSPAPISPLTATDEDGYITAFQIRSLPTSGTLYINGQAITSNNLTTIYQTNFGQLGGL
ncbi:MAG TPA: hypothetical protein VIG72_04955, partial [Pontibacter sp.]